jgi:hypothetical protein
VGIVNIIPDIEIFSVRSEPKKIFVTWAFNNLDRDRIGVLVLGLVTRRKVFRVKNPEDCKELSHQSPSVKRGQALGLLVRLSFIPLRTST